MTGQSDKKASPFAGILGDNPKDTAQEAERVLDSPHRREVEEAQAAKSAAKTKAGKEAGDDEVISVNVRNPLPPE